MIVSCQGILFTLVLYFYFYSHLSQIASTVMYMFYKFVVIFKVCGASTFVLNFHFILVSYSLYQEWTIPYTHITVLNFQMCQQQLQISQTIH